MKRAVKFQHDDDFKDRVFTPYIIHSNSLNPDGLVFMSGFLDECRHSQVRLCGLRSAGNRRNQ
jgi:hypothetical protein